MRPSLVALSGLVLAIAIPLASTGLGSASAQGSATSAGPSFDCTKARTPVERALCADPALGALDSAIAAALAAALAAPQADATALRTDQLAWLRQRDATCKLATPQIPACLKATLSARLAVLTPPNTSSAQNAGAAATPPPPLSPPPLSLTPSSPPSAVPGPRPAQNLEAFTPPAPQAHIDRPTLSATAPGETLLHVDSPGRISLAVRSTTGTALQLVDMMTGPAEEVGEPGVRDGRTDVILDAGTYKLRTRPAAGATGELTLSATPFHNAAPPQVAPSQSAPNAGTPLETTLTDLEQRALWLAVGSDGQVQVDAVGRALADLRLWRNGTDLVALDPLARLAEPVPGHPMQALHLAGKLDPGTYLAVAYGGPPTLWGDNATDTPLTLTVGLSPALTEGAIAGRLGPSGTALFAAPPRAGLFRLSLPDPAPARLDVDQASAAIATNSRTPDATLRTAPNRSRVQLSGLAGQAFQIRAVERSTATSFNKPGRWLMMAVVAGAGGDEPPPTVLLTRPEPAGGARVLASTAPLVTASAPWRTQFNVRGPTTLLLQSGTGELAVANASQGLGTLNWRPRAVPLPAGFAEYTMDLEPGRQGVADLLFSSGAAPRPLANRPPAASSATPQAVAKWPADPVIPLGVQTIDPGQRLDLVSNQGPAIQAGLLARAVPVALADGPLVLAQMPGVALDIPLLIAPGGTLIVSDPATGPLSIPFSPDAKGVATATIPAPDRPRTLVLARRPPPAMQMPIPPPSPPGTEARIDTTAPRFFNLRADQQSTFDLTVGQGGDEGGLYRIETTGRLHTTAWIGTPVTPSLDQAEANGAGENALLQRWLRAGRYRVRIRATGSAGHLGLRVTPAPLRDGDALVPGGTSRASLPEGTGLALPVTITEPGRYRLDLLGQSSRILTARLDDAAGWPLTRPGPTTRIEQTLSPGQYRLLVAPEPVAARVLARLTRLPSPTPLAATAAIAPPAHAPTALVTDAPAHATWREPGAPTETRTPDPWTFTLAGPADTTIAITDGMVATLVRTDPASPQPIARFVGPAPWSQRLEAGHYRLDATSLGRNDRFEYTVRFATKELQPGVPRQVAAASTSLFTLAEPGVATLTTFGPTPLKAILRDGGGTEIARFADRGDDWNIAVSRLLPAGAYRLELAPATPPTSADVTPVASTPMATKPAADAASDEDQPDPDPGEPKPQSAKARSQADPQADSQPAAQADPQADSQADSQADASDAPAAPTVELTLTLPAPRPSIPATAAAVALTGSGIHRLTIPQPAANHLVAAAARSTATIALSLERQSGQTWQVVAQDQGTAPFVAAPSDPDSSNTIPAPWRLSLWAIDVPSGAAMDDPASMSAGTPIQASLQVLDAPPQPLGAVTLQPIAGAATPASIARLSLPTPTLVSLKLSPPEKALGEARADNSGLIAGGWPGHALTPPDGGLAIPQSDTLWIIARTPAHLDASPIALAAQKPMAIPVPAGGITSLASAQGPAGTIRAWLAEAPDQPGLDAGQGMGAAPGTIVAESTLAIGTAPLRLWNAHGAEALRPRLTMLDLKILPAQRIDGPFTTVLPPLSALPLTLPEGERRTDLSLAPGLAALSGTGPGATTTWTGAAALTRSIPGAETGLLLLNTSAVPAPAAVAFTAEPAPATLRLGVPLKRFFGAAGSFDLPLAAPSSAMAGARLRLAGDAQATITEAGTPPLPTTVTRGTDLAIAPSARLTIAHGPGAMAVWLETPGSQAWPTVTPVAQAIPARVALHGPAMALGLTVATSTLLHATTTAPVILSLGNGPPTLYPAGAALHRAVVADTILRIDSPHDGPLSGTLDLAAEPISPIAEGLNPPTTLAPGAAAAFGFQVTKAAMIGIGVRADPDRAQLRLLDGAGAPVAEGTALLRHLEPGRYIIEVRIPPDAPTTTIRAAVVGTMPAPTGPPPDVARTYLELVGMKPMGPAPMDAPKDSKP